MSPEMRDPGSLLPDPEPTHGEGSTADPQLPVEGAQNAETVRYSVTQPEGYFIAATGDPIPWFDREGRRIVLLCHEDGSVTWQLWDKHGEPLEPLHNDGSRGDDA